MAKYFDEGRWSRGLEHADWYLRLADELQTLRKRYESPGETEAEAIKTEVREFFERKLDTGEITLADTGDDLDAERAPIDTIVIHHTSAPPGYTLKRMNAVHLLNLYVPYFANPTLEQEKHLKGKPIWSNHHDAAGRQIFYAYHWFVRMDGSVERLLEDKAIGWHAGNWDVDTRSVGICLDNDYEASNPTNDVLEAVAGIILEHYPSVMTDRILGHQEVAHLPTICPGSKFLDEWKGELLGAIARLREQDSERR